jgi:hypothetical protein
MRACIVRWNHLDLGNKLATVKPSAQLTILHKRRDTMKNRFPIKVLVVAIFITSLSSISYAQDDVDTLYVGNYSGDQVLRYTTTNTSGTTWTAPVAEAPTPWLGTGSTESPGALQGEGIAPGQDYPTNETGVDDKFGNIADPIYIVNAAAGGTNETIEVANANAANNTNPIVNATFITGLSGAAADALSPNGQDLYVAQQTGGTLGTGSISEYNALSGALITTTNVVDAHDISVNADGSVYVTAYGAGSSVSMGVEEYNASLTTSTNFIAYNSPVTPVSGTNTPTLDHATGMTFDSSGDLWVANVYTVSNSVRNTTPNLENFVAEYSPTGQLITTIYEPTTGTNTNQLFTVFGLSLGPDGNIYASSFNGEQITEINTSNHDSLSTYISLNGINVKYAIWSSDAVTYAAVPEPKTYGAMTLGAVALLLVLRLLKRTLWTTAYG